MSAVPVLGALAFAIAANLEVNSCLSLECELTLVDVHHPDPESRKLALGPEYSSIIPRSVVLDIAGLFSSLKSEVRLGDLHHVIGDSFPEG
jgi:hypothetical protein